MNNEKHLIIAIYICAGSFLLNEFIKFYMSQENIFLIQYIPLLLIIVSFIIYLISMKKE
ncbi:RNA:NAD 2'-phosphotransferase (TPT1/KptA family) [Clostridioides mangenotii]|uniref:RNA:NAD 2'-phosphotransferase (TPT1/KptA family) n=1 Tax=Metaclostridioides mangenotii TaxID=1540 RepID=A0ABS4EEL2_9FIRM|nr:RNA:NAD 2'-phosphotransferase (TPT1/KptA family) [Clostridioides mangenotii]